MPFHSFRHYTLGSQLVVLFEEGSGGSASLGEVSHWTPSFVLMTEMWLLTSYLLLGLLLAALVPHKAGLVTLELSLQIISFFYHLLLILVFYQSNRKVTKKAKLWSSCFKWTAEPGSSSSRSLHNNLYILLFLHKTKILTVSLF